MKSLSPQDIRLCEHILTQLYGHACGEIGSILLNRGRLPFSNLLRMSCLTGNSVRTALIVLIQQNTGETHGPEYFEAIPEEILTRIRFGQYINIAYGRFGIESKLIVECLLDNGKLRVGQLVTLVCDQYLHSQSRQKFDLDTDNLYDLSPLKLPQIVKSNVFNLLAERYIRPAHPKHTINPTDLALAYEKQIIAQLPGVPTPKDIRAAKEKVEEMMTTEEDEGFEELCSFEQKQRALNQNDRNPKRQKTGEVSLEGDLVAEMLSVMAKQDDLATSTTSVYTPGSLDKGLTQLNPLAIVSEKKK
ncbi:hypothetical protein Pst134EA_032882 [Puccinia striiformis f. sp. tritici]|uniref:uncharacterized protein n=1 Tax=Puccinia striiformis f. sp. tritici TaxID=168172 RepID=UPI0020081412|nr:uncharacterized protein Pst134EA_032882 [Puccinia striiformis f. sp. tritici]KAH9443497.1 hypothetical protein Pst134EA_032882 [Puccinia striiformis f. sp. tritici]